MANKLKITLFACVFTGAFLFNSLAQKNQDKKVQIKKTITQSEAISELMQPLLELPAKGDVFKKLSPKSSL